VYRQLPGDDPLLRAREDGFVTAFPDYGVATRTGLRGMGPQRLVEAHEKEEMSRQRHAAKKRAKAAFR
jgi:hypothetical protein